MPTYPEPSGIWEIVDKFQVSHLYTAPTAIRSLMAAGDQYVTRTSRASLKLLGTVGEPINPEAWKWYPPSHARPPSRRPLLFLLTETPPRCTA